MTTATAAPPVVPPRDGAVATGGQDGGGGGGWNGFRVRLWLPVTNGRPHAVAVASYSEAYELARAKEGGGHHTDFDVVGVEFKYPGRRAE